MKQSTWYVDIQVCKHRLKHILALSRYKLNYFIRVFQAFYYLLISETCLFTTKPSSSSHLQILRSIVQDWYRGFFRNRNMIKGRTNKCKQNIQYKYNLCKEKKSYLLMQLLESWNVWFRIAMSKAFSSHSWFFFGIFSHMELNLR